MSAGTGEKYSSESSYLYFSRMLPFRLIELQLYDIAYEYEAFRDEKLQIFCNYLYLILYSSDFTNDENAIIKNLMAKYLKVYSNAVDDLMEKKYSVKSPYSSQRYHILLDLFS